jgi:hypothetical protein
MYQTIESLYIVPSALYFATIIQLDIGTSLALRKLNRSLTLKHIFSYKLERYIAHGRHLFL